MAVHPGAVCLANSSTLGMSPKSRIIISRTIFGLRECSRRGVMTTGVEESSNSVKKFIRALGDSSCTTDDIAEAPLSSSSGNKRLYEAILPLVA